MPSTSFLRRFFLMSMSPSMLTWTLRLFLMSPTGLFLLMVYPDRSTLFRGRLQQFFVAVLMPLPLLPPVSFTLTPSMMIAKMSTVSLPLPRNKFRFFLS